MSNHNRRAALDQAVTNFGAAWAHGDLAALEMMLSPTYSHTDAAGDFHSRATWLGYAGKRAGRKTVLAFRDVRTRIIGDIAIITGINDLRGPGIRNPTDQVDLTLRFTQLWLWTDGRWLREAFQATPCGPEQTSFEGIRPEDLTSGNHG